MKAVPAFVLPLALLCLFGEVRASGAVEGSEPVSGTTRVEVQSTSAASNAATTHAGLSVELSGQSISSAPTSGAVAGATLGGRWQRLFTETFSADAELELYLETGAVRARYAEEFSPRQFARIRQARLKYQPLSFVELGAGAIDQSLWSSHLLFRRQSFPALVESARFTRGPVSLSFTMEQAVASDTSTRQPFGNWPTGLPAFFMEELRGKYTFSEDANVQASLGHFAYRNVRGPSAFQAQFLGNSVAGTAPADSRFLYSYQGLRLGLGGESPRFGRFSLASTNEVLWNHEAPSGRNTGWRARLTPRLHFTKTVLALNAELFEVQPDATLALYQPREFGHTNRRGFLIGVEAKLANPSMTVAAEWIESRPLVTQPWQSAMTWLQLSLKTDYELL